MKNDATCLNHSQTTVSNEDRWIREPLSLSPDASAKFDRVDIQYLGVTGVFLSSKRPRLGWHGHRERRQMVLCEQSE